MPGTCMTTKTTASTRALRSEAGQPEVPWLLDSAHRAQANLPLLGHLEQLQADKCRSPSALN